MSPRLVPRRAVSLAACTSLQLGVFFGQNMYTPDNISERGLIRNDRPYAGWLYAGFMLTSANRQLDPSLSWSDVEWIKKRWGGKLLLKGIQDAEDARLAVRRAQEALGVGRTADPDPVLGHDPSQPPQGSGLNRFSFAPRPGLGKQLARGEQHLAGQRLPEQGRAAVDDERGERVAEGARDRVAEARSVGDELETEGAGVEVAGVFEVRNEKAGSGEVHSSFRGQGAIAERA